MSGDTIVLIVTQALIVVLVFVAGYVAGGSMSFMRGYDKGVDDTDEINEKFSFAPIMGAMAQTLDEYASNPGPRGQALLNMCDSVEEVGTVYRAYFRAVADISDAYSAEMIERIEAWSNAETSEGGG